MYRYTLVYSTVGALPSEPLKEVTIFADDRDDAIEKATTLIMQEIEEGKVAPSCGEWATLGNSKGRVIAWLVGNYAMGGLRWEQERA